ncbi:MAG: hypothetical protein B6U76_07115 [Desulfurococcales archaeon ex4484_217_2]|nr:MAG: hypothetical protein B6U76_07115 [Desulfurococcales archaeon ex4484_217_2]
MTLTIADLVKQAYKRNGVVTAYVYGEFGHGKTSYALWVAYEVLGSWGKVLNHLFFEPREAVRVMGKAIDSGKRLPIIIMDDAGLWLDRLTWWEEDKVAFMQFFNLVRSIAAGVIFTTPSQELPKQILNKCFFRVHVEPISKEKIVGMVGEEAYRGLEALVEKYGLEHVYSIATGYRLKTLPSFFNFVSKEFYDIYPLHYPVFQEYEKRRRKALKQYFEKWRAKVEGSKHANKDDIVSLVKELIESGKSKREIVKTLMKLGVPRSTAYMWVKKIIGAEQHASM